MSENKCKDPNIRVEAEVNRFKKPYEKHKRYFIPTGDGMEDVWEYTVDKYGRKVLVCTGQKCLYDEIQAQLEDTKIENILARAAAGEDVFRPNGIFADVSKMPTNLIEARQQLQMLENTWNGLTQEMRNKYNNSVEDFIGSSGTEEWLQDMGLAPIKEVVENTSTEATKGLSTFGQTTEQAKGETSNEP